MSAAITSDPASAEATATATEPQPAPRLFADSNVRWLAGGGLVSMLGDQFTLLALPWLVLRLTGDPLALGTVLAAMGVPRALLMLVGGATVDRHAPRRVLLVTRHASAVLLAGLAALVASGHVTLSIIHVFAVAIGITTAFSHPAASALVPSTVPKALIQPANALLMSMRQVTMLLGPLLGAALIAGTGTQAAPVPGAAGLREATGLAWAFGLDAFSFVVAALTLLPLKPINAAPAASRRNIADASTSTSTSTSSTSSSSSSSSSTVADAKAAADKQSIAASIAEGLRALWSDPLLRALCLYVTAIGLLVGGPLQVALPVLAERQLHGDATTLGVLTAGHGAGILVGLLLAGRFAGGRIAALGSLGTTVLAIDGLAGLVFIALGQVSHSWEAVALLAPIGAMAGFVQVAVMSWIQRRVPPRMLGRAMSVLLFLIMGLAPLSSALAGYLLRIVPSPVMFAACGLTMMAVATIGAIALPMRRID
ncbi:MFS transporter [Roseateles sp. L2-2]|uniref:MFS transporter n=1 Tax=Roseateles sp. L2-2 TaxID=3422597 RepID=UPI003D36196A